MNRLAVSHPDPQNPAPGPESVRPEEPRRARERHLRRYGPPRGSSTWIYWTVAVIGLLVFALLMRAVMEKTRWTAPDAATFVADPASAAVAAGA